MTVKINKPAINLREELASLRNQGGLPKEDKLYVGDFIQNGDFSNGTTGWTASNASHSVVNGALRITLTTNGSGKAYQAIKTQIGKTYSFKVAFSNPQGNVNNLFMQAATTAGGADILNEMLPSTATTENVFFTATTTTTYIGLGLSYDANESIDVDNISVQEVGENLVTNGTFDSGTTGWTEHTSPTSVSTTGGVLRIQTTNHRAVYQDIAVKAGQTYQLRLDVTANTDGMARMYIGTPNSTFAFGNHNGLTVGSYLFTFVVGATDSVLRLQPATHAAVGDVSFDNFVVTEGNHQVIQSIPHGYDVKDVYIDGELAREGEGYDYEVQTDGINQWIKPSVEPTATTETVVIGVRK